MTNTQELIAKLKNLDATMTRGKWFSDGLKIENQNHDIAICDPTPPHLRSHEDARTNAHGIAALKNANPHVVAMLERAIDGLKKADDGSDGAASAYAEEALADLERLAAKAMKEMG